MSSLNTAPSVHRIDSASESIPKIEWVSSILRNVSKQIEEWRTPYILESIALCKTSIAEVMDYVMRNVNDRDTQDLITQVQVIKGETDEILKKILSSKSENASLISKTMTRFSGIFQWKQTSSERAKNRVKDVLHQTPSPQLLASSLYEAFDKMLAEIE